MISTQAGQIRFQPSSLHYATLWLKVNFLKLVSFGLYAPWGNEAVRHYLLSNFQLNNYGVDCQGAAKTIFKLRLTLVLLIFCLLIIDNFSSGLTWLWGLLLISVLPAFYLLEKNTLQKSCLINNKPIKQEISLISFYRAIFFPLASFLLLSSIIFNSAFIDSRILASIAEKEEAPLFSEDSYLAKTEKSLNHLNSNISEHHGDHTHHRDHDQIIEKWSDDISADEIAYLEDHEKSHNHGNIALTRLQKYQIANQGNLFAQYALVLLVFLIIWPWLDFKIISYRINHSYFNNEQWQLNQGLFSFYRLYLQVSLAVLLLLCITGAVISQFLMGNEGSSPEFWSNALVNGLWFLPLVVFLIVFACLLLNNWRQQWLLANLNSLPLGLKFNRHYLLGGVLSLAKTILLMVSFGLAIPYCQILSYRMLNKHLAIKSR